MKLQAGRVTTSPCFTVTLGLLEENLEDVGAESDIVAIEAAGVSRIGDGSVTAIDSGLNDPVALVGGGLDADQLAQLQSTAVSMMIEYRLPIITKNPDGRDRGKGGTPKMPLNSPRC